MPPKAVSGSKVAFPFVLGLSNRLTDFLSAVKYMPWVPFGYNLLHLSDDSGLPETARCTWEVDLESLAIANAVVAVPFGV